MFDTSTSEMKPWRKDLGRAMGRPTGPPTEMVMWFRKQLQASTPKSSRSTVDAISCLKVAPYICSRQRRGTRSVHIRWDVGAGERPNSVRGPPLA